MLTQERYDAILAIINERGAASVTDLVEMLHSSESTVRRDLNALAQRGMLHKVHGGATAVKAENARYMREEYGVDYKTSLNVAEKERIARYAASLITRGDFVFLDAGTTTESMLAFLTCREAVYVTTGVMLARRLARDGFQAYVPAGRIKPVTEAIVGSETMQSLAQYHFTIGFFGCNGIAAKEGFTTPDIEEARTKAAALSRCRRRIVLADHTKFDVVSSVSFAALRDAEILTDQPVDSQYHGLTAITEVDLA